MCQRQCNKTENCNAINYRGSDNRCQLMQNFVNGVDDCHVKTGEDVEGWVYKYKECALGES